ncbi:alpha/beta hydrolase [Halalkalibacterium halodurans]|nr:alpha/beta hydrolase [Halalkalibacterium halodurans]
MVIRPDLRGHGKSVGTIDGDYFGHCVKDLADTLKALNVTQCHLAGVSLGGIVGLLFAKEFPEMVKSLSFSSIFPVKPDDWDEQMRQELERYRQLFDSDEVVSFMDKIHGKNDWTSLLVRFCDDDFYPV